MQSMRLVLDVTLDDVDEKILDVLRRYPSRSWKVHQIRTILQYEGIELGSGHIRYRLQILSALSLVRRERARRGDRYGIMAQK